MELLLLNSLKKGEYYVEIAKVTISMSVWKKGIS